MSVEIQVITNDNRITTLENNPDSLGLDSRLTAAEGTLTAATGRLDTAESSISTNTASIAYNQQMIENINNVFSAFPTDGGAIDLQDIVTRLDAAENSMTTSDGRITAVEGRLDIAEPKITAAEGRLDLAEGSIIANKF